MLDTSKDLKIRERWTQLHMSTCQTLNVILRDNQFREWEKKLRELEEYGHVTSRTSGLG